MSAFSRLSLSRQFLIASFPVLLIGILLIGAWIGKQVEHSVAYRIGGVAGMYVDSFIAPHVQTLIKADELSHNDRVELDQLLTKTALGEKIVALKIWRKDGRVLYSSTKDLIGRTFPIGEGLQVALAGDVHSELSDLTGYENEFEKKNWSQLIETYLPLHANGAGNVIAVAEFYHTTDELNRESRAAQVRSWSIVVAIIAAMYALLFALVHRGSKTIDAQRTDLNEKVTQLTAFASQNEQLHDKVRRAATRTIALNEVFLRRLSADLHDGPGQDMSLALMKFETMGDVHTTRAGTSDAPLSCTEEFRTVRNSLQSALTDLRAISAGLQLPEIEKLSICEVAARAIRDYKSKTGAQVTLTTAKDLVTVSLSVKIALYRLLQESIANSFRHANGMGQHVDIKVSDGRLMIEVSDQGAGFDTRAFVEHGHMGLEGMRERVEILGGSFDLRSVPGQGTRICATLPLLQPGPSQEEV